MASSGRPKDAGVGRCGKKIGHSTEAGLAGKEALRFRTE
jgi:hypothetical protein